jgi:non-specific serine/threonine protein kinase
MQAALASDGQAFATAVNQELLEIVACDPHYSWNAAQCYALMGDTAASLDWIEKAMSKGFINYPMISRWDPLLTPIRHADRYDEIADTMRERWEHFEV